MSEGERSQAEWRRLRRRAIEARRRTFAERDTLLDSSLEPAEHVVARRHAHPLVTDRRILHARQLWLPPRGGNWVVDSIRFEEIMTWSLGSLHDGRPLLELQHAPRTTIEHGPAHRFLGFRWGDAEAPAVRTKTRLGFGRSANPVLVAILAELGRREVPHGPTFVIRPAGSRAERKRAHGPVVLAYRRARIRSPLWRVTDVVYRGQVAWPLRALSWVVVGVPAWLISPWLVVPAILLAELVWIGFMQWTWRRDRARRGDSTSAVAPGDAVNRRRR